MANILVVEDNMDLRETVKDILEHAGHCVTTAKCAWGALALIERNAFQLVLTGAKLPGLTGLELAKRIREENHKLPVVVMSGSGSMLKEAFCEGQTAVLAKPFRSTELLTALNDAMHM